MSARLTVSLTLQARAQIAEAAAWWERNRPGAPGAVREDLDDMLSLLCAQPDIGTRARLAGLRGVRRVTLSRVRYYVFYRINGNSLEVLAFWHTSRGSNPA